MRLKIVLAVWVAAGVALCLGGGRVARAERPSIDDARVRAAGLRQIAGRHLTLVTDLPSDPEIDALPAVFDAAVPQWAAYFGVPAEKTADWQVRCYLIGDRAAFDDLGFMPAVNDQFIHGIASGSELWLYDQPTAYYRRHLLLHEGVHAFMAKFLGGCGPGWYMEGTAELLATHRLAPKRGQAPRIDSDQRVETEIGSEPAPFLELRIMPRDRREVPMLGRVKLVRDAVAQGRALSLDAVMQLDNRRQMDNEGYAWCWAAAKWLDAHPRYRDRFRRLYKNVKKPDFNRRMREIYADDWSDLAVEWQAYVRMLDHNYDFEQTAIWFLGGFPLKSGGANLQLRADRGWQSSGARLEAGRTYRIRAGGRYEIVREVSDDREQVWWSEPGGVTIEYHDGFPLGMLLGAIDARTADGRAASEKGTESVGFAHPFAVGLQKTITPAAGGTLYLRVNDSGGRLDDNRGGLAVMIEAVDAAGDDARSRETP